MKLLEEQREFQRKEADEQRRWQAAEADRADKRHQETLEIANKHHRWDLIVMGGVVTVIVVLSQLAAAFIERGDWFKASP